MPHPHIVKVVVNDGQRIEVMKKLRWRFNDFDKKNPGKYRVFQDRINHISLSKMGRPGEELTLVFEYTVIIVPLTIHWDKIRSIKSTYCSAIDFKLMYEELDKIRKGLEHLAGNPPVKPVKNVVTLKHMSCVDWVLP